MILSFSYIRRLTTIVVIHIALSSASYAQSQNDEVFSDAMRQIELGQWQEARLLLENQLMLNPNWHRARVELVNVYAELEEYELALIELNKVLSQQQIPSNVKTNLENLKVNILEKTAIQSSLKQQQSKTNSPHTFAHYTELGWGFDSNVLFTSGDYFLLDDPFLNSGIFIDDEGQEIEFRPDGFAYDLEGNRLFEISEFFDLGDLTQDTSFAEYGLSLSHQYQAADSAISWQNDLVVKATKGAEFSEFDRQFLSLTSELEWRANDQLKLALGVNYRLLGRDYKKQIDSHSLFSSATYYNQYGSWELGLNLTKRKFQSTRFQRGDFITEFGGFSSDNIDLSLKWSRLFFDNRLLLLTKVDFLHSDAAKNFESYDYEGSKYTLAFVYRITNKLKWSASAYSLKLDYDNLFVNSSIIVDDKSKEISSKLSYDFNKKWQLALSAERSLRNSEASGGLKSDKNIIKLSVKYSF